MHIKSSRSSALMPELCKTQTVRRDIPGLTADGQLEILFEKREVCVADIADKRNEDASLRLFGSEVLRTRRFGKPAQATPEVEFPGDIQRRLRVRVLQALSHRDEGQGTEAGSTC